MTFCLFVVKHPAYSLEDSWAVRAVAIIKRNK